MDNARGHRAAPRRARFPEPLNATPMRLLSRAFRATAVRAAVACLGVLLVAANGCSIRQFAINKVGDALARGGDAFGSDEDPDLIRDAAPTSLKLMESLLAESPRHEGLLLATARGFTQYAFAFVDAPADELEEKDFAAASAMHQRAKRLYLRARDYGLRGLEVRHARIAASIRTDPKSAVRRLAKRDVPLMYWTAAAWASAITLGKDQPDLVADQPSVEALVDRALELDEAYDDGALHAFLISYEPARQGARGDPASRSRRHLDRAVELSRGRLASPFVSFAESVCVQNQDVKDFRALLGRALEVDVNARPDWRLENLVMQRRARWLLSRVEELFLDAAPAPVPPRP
jgi:predicted anti-sigma-YlaC factor YlaD